MTYEHQRKILEYLRSNFEFKANHYYFFDMAKMDVENSIFDYDEFESEKEHSEHCKNALKKDLFHIVVFPSSQGDIMLGVNGDGFDYYENLSTGEIQQDDCDFGPLDPIQLKIEMIQIKRELNSCRDS